MEGRIANLIRANLRSAFHYFPKCLEDSCVRIAAIGLRVLFVVPQADSKSFRSPWKNKCEFVLEAFLLSKYGQGFILDQSRKLRNAIGFEADGDAASKYGNLLKVGF